MLCKLVIVCSAAFVLTGAAPSFRILAPPFVCPKDKEAVLTKPDHTIITLQTDAGITVNFTWSVRWHPIKAPTQLITVTLWKVVRKLERDLNGPPMEPGVYVVDNSELLSGVNYIFNVTASFPEYDEIVNKTFQIDNIKGDPTLLIEEQSNKFSVAIIGGQLTYTDLDYVLEAQVTTCFKTNDYHFLWSVSSIDSDIDVSNIRGSRLEFKANSLKPGLFYNVLCRLIKSSTGEIITEVINNITKDNSAIFRSRRRFFKIGSDDTENGLPFKVLHRDLNIHFNFEKLLITVDTAFDIVTDIETIDYQRNEMEIVWECSQNDKQFEDFLINDDSILTFPSGLPTPGEYIITVTLSVLGKLITTQTTARIVALETKLPIIELNYTTRQITKDSNVYLSANISDVMPGCSVAWYFSYDECLSQVTTSSPAICTESENGIPISNTTYFYSLEENFLSELTDYSNETSWKLVTTVLEAASGRARIVANCQCEGINSCSTEGTVYADVKLEVIRDADPGEVFVIVMPETGTAMETEFRISTLASVDPYRPLRYTFYCDLGNDDSLILGSYVEYLAIETLLPYKDGGTAVWVEVCDSLGVCAKSLPTVLDLMAGDARMLDALIEEVQALIRRCEIELMRRLAMSAIVTYTSTNQADTNAKFMSALLTTLQDIDRNCTESQYNHYDSLLQWLTTAGIDTSDLDN